LASLLSAVFINGAEVGGEYSYVRQNSNSYNPVVTDEIIDSEELRCNMGATNAASETYEVTAGDTIGFKLAFNELIEHPGPGKNSPNKTKNMFWMYIDGQSIGRLHLHEQGTFESTLLFSLPANSSKAPDGDVSSYDGSGDWFKVWESGLSGSASDETNWGTYQADGMEFTLPTDIPNGE
jgi:hypothetical protein